MNNQEKSPERLGRHDSNYERNSVAHDAEIHGPSSTAAPRKKSLAFYLSFAAIMVNLFLYALDATTLAVATPVSHVEPAQLSKYAGRVCWLTALVFARQSQPT